MDEEDLQKKYMEYQVLDQRIKHLQQQQQSAEEQLVQIMATLQSIEDFSSLEEGSEILVPLNNGIFTKASLKKEQRFLVNVGSSVVVDKTVEATKNLLEQQKESIDSIREKIMIKISKLVGRASELEKELNNLISED